MLASASRSACSPAPLVGSVAANVRTAGRVWIVSFMGRRGRGLHLKPGSRCAHQPGILGLSTRLQRARAFLPHSTSTANASAHVVHRNRNPSTEDVALSRVRLDL